jgi:hypothetical protein
MKIILLSLFTLSIAVAEQSVTPLQIGDEASRIQEVLGEPNGLIQTATTGVYAYDRGEIRTRNGEVTYIALISEEEHARLQEELARQREERQKEGQAVLAALLESGELNSLSGREQVNYWTSFRQRYPGVEIGIPYQQALQLARAEKEEAAKEERLARLEERVIEAELQAAKAKSEAAVARLLAADRQNRQRPVSFCYVTPYTSTITYRGHTRRISDIASSRRSIGIAERRYPKPTITRDTSLLNIRIR